jgi:hypothetical protein
MSKDAQHSRDPRLALPRQRVSADDDPMGDVTALLDELHAARFDRRLRTFMSFFVCFADRASWEAAAADASESWQVASYSQAGTHVIRMSRSVKVTADRLRDLRTSVTSFANDHGGRWESLVIEDSEPANKWTLVAERYLPHELPVEQTQPATGTASGTAPRTDEMPKQSSPTDVPTGTAGQH